MRLANALCRFVELADRPDPVTVAVEGDAALLLFPDLETAGA
jgi:hypothetical protein